ncbi:laccase-2 [Ricinus communis]|uniref:Laccase n=1 Tax=Ricinus communis TaxID=3988 RepID=B9SMB1_RICCO|nr:laccase-2 [Ricinus communis]EEF35293.1 laccase, putative [Ricinus communis]|eukprot:XP_002527130.1 laccase-2 isoform X2 [Ricinus communis]
MKAKMGWNPCLVGDIFLASLVFGLAHGAAHHYYDFILKETNFTRLCSTKSMLTVNDSFPGPEIHVHKGDTVFVNVHNHGEYGVTIHWHGVRQPRNPWSDGPENVTQCLIPPGTSFIQEINFSSEEGTLWWHAHSDWSRATVHGAIVIYPEHGTSYPFPKPDAESTIVLASWYKADVMNMITQALATGADPNVSDAFTINGQPGDLYDCSNETIYRMMIEYGKTYLIRIINAILNEEMFFGIARHNLTIVGTDGAYVKPVTVDYIVITPGQTMDVLVTANQAPSRYYIVSSPFADTTSAFDNTTTTAILEYTNGNCTTPPSPISLPIFPAYNDSDAVAVFTSKLKALASSEHPINVPKNVTRHLYMTISTNLLPCPNASCSGSSNGDRLSASLNNISFNYPFTSILQAYYWNWSNIFTTDFPDEPPVYFNFTGNVDNITLYTSLGTNVIMVDYNESVEIVFQGTNLMVAENHPMHLHGFSFFLVGTGRGNFDNATDPLKYNLIDPPEVNTIGVPKNGWAAIRFYADNPGVWFVHCHLERHTSWGMDTVIIVKNGGTNDTSIRSPPPYMPPCSMS